MNFLKKGPELKKPEMKVPDFVYDIYYDLKEHHLLPLVVLLIAAMIAAPIYFSHKNKPPTPEVAVIPNAGATASSADGGEALIVSRSEPGLRAYKRRLEKNTALDPFRGGAGGAVTEEENSGESSGTSDGESTETPVAPEEATIIGGEEPSTEAPIEIPTGTPGGASNGSGAEETTGPAPRGEGGESTSAGGKTQTRYAADTIDVRIVTVPPKSNEQKNGKQAKPQADVRRNLPELTMLPARGTPAATYMGISKDGKKALFLVSSDVVSLFGEGKCVIGSQTCQLIALEPGLPETFVYGPQERTYRIQLLKIDLSYSSKPRRASLGTSKGKGGKNHHGSKGSEGGGGAGGAGTGGGGGSTGSEPAGRGNG
jgi:hypothetical protein